MVIRLTIAALASLVCALHAEALAAPEAKVTLVATPDGGLQPQAAIDAAGTMHLIYFKGDPGAGDLFYVRRAAGAERFSDPRQVNSAPKSAVAVGRVRGGQIALGKAGRVHVVWNGAGGAICYSRLDDEGTAFEKQSDLKGGTSAIDGGGTVAADDAGSVYVVWHALRGAGGEQDRRVFVARSTDEGKTFARESPAWDEATGVCPCCSTRALAGSNGSLSVLYRSAGAGVHRDIYLLASRDSGRSFAGTLLHKWTVPG